jgi:hypothetical protein
MLQDLQKNHSSFAILRCWCWSDNERLLETHKQGISSR